MSLKSFDNSIYDPITSNKIHDSSRQSKNKEEERKLSEDFNYKLSVSKSKPSKKLDDENEIK